MQNKNSVRQPYIKTLINFDNDKELIDKFSK